MDETLLSDLVALIRRSPAEVGHELAARLAGAPQKPSEAELGELARRARAWSATDEEVTLAIAALLATARTSVP